MKDILLKILREYMDEKKYHEKMRKNDRTHQIYDNPLAIFIKEKAAISILEIINYKNKNILTQGSAGRKDYPDNYTYIPWLAFFD